MHDDFPTDPITITVGVLTLLAAIFGWLGGGMLWALILGGLAAVPLLLVEWIGFLIYEHLIQPRRATSGRETA